MTLEAADIQEIARQVVAFTVPPEIALPLREAMKRTGFNSIPAFHQWARKIGLRSMKGARGRYAVDAIKAACERATKQSRR